MKCNNRRLNDLINQNFANKIELFKPNLWKLFDAIKRSINFANQFGLMKPRILLQISSDR